jgi:uncharacterized protein YukE
METMMITIPYEAAKKLATDIRSTHTAIDDALANIAALTTSMIDVCRASDIPPATSQAAFEHMTSGLTKMVDARAGFVSAHRKIAQVQGRSNLQVVNFGCVGDGPITNPKGKKADGLSRIPLRVVNN